MCECGKGIVKTTTVSRMNIEVMKWKKEIGITSHGSLTMNGRKCQALEESEGDVFQETYHSGSNN